MVGGGGRREEEGEEGEREEEELTEKIKSSPITYITRSTDGEDVERHK